MQRREFITLLGGAAVGWPVVARSQQAGKVARIGVLINSVATNSVYQAHVAAFVQNLRNLGWVEGQNVRIEVRWVGGDAERATAAAVELVGLAPDVILSSSTTNLMALQRATRSVPIVFVQVSDPVAQGFVPMLARPGGNITGFSYLEFSVGGKWVDLLKQIVPELAHVAVMSNPDTSPQTKYFLRAVEAAASPLGVQVAATPVRAAANLEPAIESLSRQANSGLIFPTDSFTALHQELIVELTTRYRVPAVSADTNFAKDGGLMYYGPTADNREQFRQAASYVDRILKGTKPGDLPVQLSALYQLIVNLKTARALGLTVPIPLLVRADEVIE